MKRLDFFSKFENSMYVFCGVAIFVGPLFVVYLIDKFFFREHSPFTRYSLCVGAYIVGVLICLALVNCVREFFSGIRKIFKMKPFEDIEAEINDERAEAELATEEHKERWFTGCPENKQRYNLYCLQQKQLSKLNEIHKSIKFIKYLLIIFSLYMLFQKIFG